MQLRVKHIHPCSTYAHICSCAQTHTKGFMRHACVSVTLSLSYTQTHAYGCQLTAAFEDNEACHVHGVSSKGMYLPPNKNYKANVTRQSFVCFAGRVVNQLDKLMRKQALAVILFVFF